MDQVKTLKDHFGKDVFEGDEIIHSAIKPGIGLLIRKGVINRITGNAAWVDWEFDHFPQSKVWGNFVLLDVDTE